MHAEPVGEFGDDGRGNHRDEAAGTCWKKTGVPSRLIRRLTATITTVVRKVTTATRSPPHRSSNETPEGHRAPRAGGHPVWVRVWCRDDLVDHPVRRRRCDPGVADVPDQPVDVGEPGEVEGPVVDLLHGRDRGQRRAAAGADHDPVVGDVDVDVLDAVGTGDELHLCLGVAGGSARVEQHRTDLGGQVEDLGDGADVEPVDGPAGETAIVPGSMVSIVAWRVPVIRRRERWIYSGSTRSIAQAQW